MAEALFRKRLQIKETAATIVAAEPFLPLAEADIRKQRGRLEDYIRRDPGFRTALAPRSVPPEAPPIVRRMARAASRAGVGPMAAVAGALAESALRAMAEAGATHALVDNGGDIALLLERPVTVGIFTGPSPIRDIAFRVEPRPGIFGICASSGTVGHSLSFGRADAAVVLSADVGLADAVATALGNAVTDEDETRLRETLAALGGIEGVEGLLAVVGKTLAVWGDLPPIVRTRVDPARISR